MFVAAVSDADVDRIRSELQSLPVSIFESPPLRARLVHREGGDYLMLAIHHAASDGMGALRLLQSVLRDYANVDDPPAAIRSARGSPITRSTANHKLDHRPKKLRKVLSI